MKTTRISFTLSGIARILFLVFRSICMLAAVLTVTCMILTVLLMLGLAAHEIAGWTGVIFYILVLLGLAFLYPHT